VTGVLAAITPTKPSASTARVIVRMILSLNPTHLVVEGVCHNDNAQLDYRVPCGNLYKIEHKTQSLLVAALLESVTKYSGWPYAANRGRIAGCATLPQHLPNANGP
jgi:hypothetical protein